MRSRTLCDLEQFWNFTDDEHLIWAWLTVDKSAAAKRKKNSPPQPLPSHLHLLVLDTKTGQKQALQEWATPYFPICLAGLPDGKFLTCTGAILRLFSPNFQIVWKKALSPADAFADYDIQNGFTVSPNRKLLLVLFRQGDGYQAELLNIETSSAVAKWEEKRPISVSAIAEHSILGFCGQPPSWMCIRSIGQPWVPFRPADLDIRMTDAYKSSTRLANDNTVVIESGNEMAAVNLGGTILFQTKLEKNHSFDTIATSSGGTRFAVIESHLAGVNIEFLDLSKTPRPDRIAVYSIPDRSAVYSLGVNGTWEEPALALSPHGDLLAVVIRGILAIYTLPPNSTRN